MAIVKIGSSRIRAFMTPPESPRPPRFALSSTKPACKNTRLARQANDPARLSREEIRTVTVKKGKKEEASARQRFMVQYEFLRRVGGSNFRDLGGHPTRLGGKVRAGQVF